MKRLYLLTLLTLTLSACAYNNTEILAVNGSYVDCTASVEKPVTVDTLGELAKEADITPSAIPGLTP